MLVAFLVIPIVVAATGGSGAIGAAACWLGGALAVWRFAFFPYVEITETALVVQNPLRRYAIPWQDIASVRGGYNGLEISRRNGSSVDAWAIQGTNVATWFGWQTRADEAAEAITQYAAVSQKAREPAPPG
jgi:hypothetical protein